MVVVPSNIIERFGLTSKNLETIGQDHLHRERPSAVAAFAALIWGVLDGITQKVDIFSSAAPSHTNTARLSPSDLTFS